MGNLFELKKDLIKVLVNFVVEEFGYILNGITGKVKNLNGVYGFA